LSSALLIFASFSTALSTDVKNMHQEISSDIGSGMVVAQQTLPKIQGTASEILVKMAESEQRLKELVKKLVRVTKPISVLT